MKYFKVDGDDMFIPEGIIIRLFRGNKDGRWYVTLPDWTNVPVENRIPHELRYFELDERRKSE